MVVALALAFVGCQLAGPANAVSDSSPTFRRQGGSRISFPGPVRAWCESGALYVVTLGGIHQSRWQLTLSPTAFRSGSTVTFTWRRGHGVELFVYDAQTDNEAAESAEGSRGRFVIRRATCTRGRAVEITMSAFLASEFFDGKPIRASGTLSTKIGARPR